MNGGTSLRPDGEIRQRLTDSSMEPRGLRLKPNLPVNLGVKSCPAVAAFGRFGAGYGATRFRHDLPGTNLPELAQQLALTDMIGA